MRKLLLLFFCAFLALLDPAMALADAAAAAAAPATTEEAVRPRLPRSSYKRYRGNSRRKRGPFAAMKRWRTRQRTKRITKTYYRNKAKQRRGVITVDRPMRNK